MSQPYVLPNRKTFADYITRVFLKYRCNKEAPGNRELFPYQKIIRDYLLIETPYRGLLVYHGLGSGKTCSSIAVAESLLSTSKVFVMLPKSLEENYLGEIRKCGDPIYAYDQHWTMKVLDEKTRAEALALGISRQFLERNGKFYVTTIGEEANYKNLPSSEKELIGKQIEDIINQRFTFIAYNGLNSSNINRVVPPDEPNKFDDTVVIVDEVHDFISRIVNKSDIARKLYDAIYHAKRCKIVALSGTPIINRPNEIACLMNLLRGPIERVNISFKNPPQWDEERMTTVLRSVPDVDTIEFNTIKKTVMVTRNPPQFRSVYNEKGDRIAVQYIKDMKYSPNANEWVSSWKDKFETDVGGAEIALERTNVEELECLPSEYEEFASTFLDGLLIKNPLLFKKRIQGLVSYYRGADESVLPRRVDDDKMLELVPMSKEQFARYLDVRWNEMKNDSKKRMSLNDDLKTFRVKSRLVCNYAVPPDLRDTSNDSDNLTEDDLNPKEMVMAKMRSNPAKYLSKQALTIFSPKMLRMLENIEESIQGEKRRSQFVYSNYRTLEGLGVFSAILDANGWQEYRIVKINNQWVEDPTMDQTKPAYAFYTGEESAELRELARQVFNQTYADDFPESLKASLEGKTRKLCLLMASSSGAQGITLMNVRHVHLMEPHWTPTRHDQVIGRAIRINSHASLPEQERTVRVSFYLSVFTDEQAKSTEYPNIVPIRRNDTGLKRYMGEQAVEAFMSTDESLYEVAYEKDVIGKRISLLLKEGAIDCEIHRKLHGKEKPVISCMRFDTNATGEDLAFRPSIKNDDLDVSYLRNMMSRVRNLQKVQIKEMIFYIDKKTSEVFDGPAFEDNNRLMRIGLLTSPTQIKFILV